MTMTLGTGPYSERVTIYAFTIRLMKITFLAQIQAARSQIKIINVMTASLMRGLEGLINSR